MPKHLKDLVSTIIPKTDSWQIFLLQEWNTIIGDLKVQVRLEKIQEDTLVLSVSSASWMQELYCLSDVLIKKINAQLPQPYIKKLRFNCTTSRTKKFIPQTYIQKATPHQEIVLNFAQKKALEKIKDPQLQRALQSFLVRCIESSNCLL